ncbi:hypothetical protein AB8101_002034 [Vibrio vulnificus]
MIPCYRWRFTANFAQPTSSLNQPLRSTNLFARHPRERGDPSYSHCLGLVLGLC